MSLLFFFIFFFKQKTAYEMRISDWSSDVCSSDLTLENTRRAVEWFSAAGVSNPYDQIVAITCRPDTARKFGIPQAHIFPFWEWVGGRFSLWRSEERRVGNECVSTCRSRCLRNH